MAQTLAEVEAMQLNIVKKLAVLPETTESLATAYSAYVRGVANGVIARPWDQMTPELRQFWLHTAASGA